MEKKSITGLKKRQQIQKANKTVFLWVMAASVALVVLVVLGYFLVRQMIFNQKVISAKSQTNSILVQNKESFETLKDEVGKLVANSDLMKLRVSENDTALQVIIDALPTTDDRAALGSSMQQVVLAQSGVSIESISVVDSSGVAAPVDAGMGVADPTLLAPTEIVFSMVLNGNYEQLRRAVTDIERTIRPISINSIRIEGGGTQLRMTVSAKTYYLPAKTVELKTETLAP